MSLIGQSPALATVALGLFVAFSLLRLGHGLLDLLRDLRAFREGR